MVDPHPLRAEFSIAPGLVHLNHAGVAPIPRRARLAACTALEELERNVAGGYHRLEEMMAATRASCARLLEVDPGEVAFVPNTSLGLSMVGLGVEWRAGDEIVTTDQEFPSNLLIWRDLARRLGLVLHEVPSRPDGGVDAAELLNRITPRTRVVAVSAVQFSTGAVVEVAELGRELANGSTLLVVDAIQNLGAFPVHPRRLGADVVVADGHKWLLAPEGCGMMYISPKGMELIAPRLWGWHMVNNPGNYQRVSEFPRSDARRFEPGSPNVAGIAALGASVELLREAGGEVVASRILQLVRELARGARELGYRLHLPDGDEPGAGILVFSHPRLSHVELSGLLTAARVIQVQRGKGVRFSPHFYQDQREVERVLRVLEELNPGARE